MTQLLTDQQLDEIDARADAATPGEWTAVELPPNDTHRSYYWVNTECTDDGDIIDQTVADCPWRMADAEFIAHARQDVPALTAEIRRLRAELAAERAPFHLHSASAIADADDPTPLRWGLNDVMWGDDDTVTVLLSGPDGEPYWLELDQERAAVLREDLAGPSPSECPGPEPVRAYAPGDQTKISTCGWTA